MTAQRERIDFVSVEMPVNRIRLRFASDAGYSGEWDAHLEPISGGTRIEVVERATVPSPLGRIIARLLFDPTEFATIYLASLKTRVEGKLMPKKPTDWRKRFGAAKPPHVVMLHADFAGVKAGTTMLISSPGDIAIYLAKIPKGETRTIARLRNELARKADAQSMCPVTTAIYLRVVAEVSLRDLEEGKRLDEVIPFWRVVTPDSKVAKNCHVAQNMWHTSSNSIWVSETIGASLR